MNFYFENSFECLTYTPSSKVLPGHVWTCVSVTSYCNLLRLLVELTVVIYGINLYSIDRYQSHVQNQNKKQFRAARVLAWLDQLRILISIVILQLLQHITSGYYSNALHVNTRHYFFMRGHSILWKKKVVSSKTAFQTLSMIHFADTVCLMSLWRRTNKTLPIITPGFYSCFTALKEASLVFSISEPLEIFCDYVVIT